MKLDFLKRKKKETFSRKKDTFDPRLYWMLVFFMGLVITICSFVFGFFLFMEVNDDTVSETVSNQSTLGIPSGGELDSAIRYFLKKEETSGDIFNSSLGVVDPSL